ncbi:hypothetical protein AB0F91_04350 [Amycolatopsis sp. NPDC023774]|uniref:hypothetical protein n=1 Tax=Amycolatopsis sp. NPDC023774 TaxID=3155015 RepID=UPI0033F8476A
MLDRNPLPREVDEAAEGQAQGRPEEATNLCKEHLALPTPKRDPVTGEFVFE